MRVLLFEWLTGGGQWISNEAPDPSNPFQLQGRSMLTALIRDFAANGVAMTVLQDSRISLDIPGIQTVPVASASELPKRLLEQAEFCDWVLLIAPESDACLLRCCQWIEPLDHKLISPDLQFVRLAADKQLTLEHLARSHIPVPPGGRLSELSTHQSAIGLPAVVKPIDGAGSERVQLIENWAAIEDLGHWDNWRVESYVPGYAVSVSVLCGNQQFKLLPPTGQQFDREPFGNYIGSIYPLPAVIADRASELAARVMRAMPITRGYLGIDLVVPDPKDYPDLPAVVIEVNPRLTMSYIRLSQILGPAVARAMLELATTGRITTP